MKSDQKDKHIGTYCSEDSPLVSIIMPTYKRYDSLKRTIDSIVLQTLDRWELIIVNDNDPSSNLIPKIDDIIETFNLGAKIRHVKHDRNKGACAARNTGIKESKGEFVAFIDDDDVWKKDKLEIQIASFKSNPNSGFCFSNLIYVDLESGKRETVEFGFSDEDFQIQLLKKGTGICTSALLIKKDLLIEINGFDTTLPSYQDFDLLMRLSAKSKPIYIQTPLLEWIVSPYGISRDFEAKYIGQKRILEKYKKEYSSKEVTKNLARQCEVLGDYAVLSGKRGEGVRSYFKSIRLNYVSIPAYVKLMITLVGGRTLYQLISNSKQYTHKLLTKLNL